MPDSTIITHILTATSTIADGNMSFRFGDAEDVVQNRKSFLAKYGIDFNNHACMSCNHGERILVVDEDTEGRGASRPEDMPQAEVLITKEKGLALMLLTADCIPGIFYDPVKDVIALAHLNRKTIAHHLGQKTIRTLSEEFGTDPKDLIVHFGPHIRQASYRFPLPLTDKTPAALHAHIHEVHGHAEIDMTSAETAELIAAGVQKENIRISDVDTFTSPDHFSHYESTRDDQKLHGRFATIAMLRP